MNKVNVQPEKQLNPLKKPKRKNSMAQPAFKFKQLAGQQFQQKALVLCQFCGGASCKQEDYRTNKIQPNAIQGLHSNWITNCILAMQRPSERLIKQYNIYDKFKKQKINTILNLQQPGQHPDCGDGILKSAGFSYDPEGFFNCGISFFNQSWEDMTATTFDHMMRIMNIFYASIVRDQGKIAVHCHAGRGRTLLVICSWLIYHDRWPAKTTIDVAVERREGVLTRSSQREFLQDFQQQLKQRWVSFGTVYGQTFSEFVQNQRLSLLKHEQKQSRFRPYVHWKIIQQFENRMKKDQNISKDVMMALVSSHHLHFDKHWNEQHQQELSQLKKHINQHTLFSQKQNTVQKVQNRVLAELLYDFYDQLPFALFNVHATQFLIQHADKLKEDNKLGALFEPQFVHETGVQAISVLLDLVFFAKKLTERNLLKKQKEDEEILNSLIMRIGLLLTSKRKYCKKLFSQKDNYRKCKIIKYDQQKLKKYTSQTQVKFVQYIKQLMNQIGKQGKQLDEILTKVRKIQANLTYFAKKHTNEQQYIQKHLAKQIYTHSREN